MADPSQMSRHVAYAERFASGSISQFNAFAALDRARLLMRETRRIEEIFEEAEKGNAAPWSWQNLEVVPYTLVGLATCLEWHARSRLTDLYTFKPDSIDRQVLEGKVQPKVLSDMIKAKVSIPQLIGASVSIGSLTDYTAAFDQLFLKLGIERKTENLIQPRMIEQNGLFGEPIRQQRVRDKIELLFESRHALVHEIGHDSGTGRTLCEIWDPPKVLSMCHTVISTIEALERALTDHAPADFPNLLSVQGYPIDVGSRLALSIEQLESLISAEIARRPADSQAAWTEALGLTHRSTETHERFFSDRKLFEERLWTGTSPLYRTILEQRIVLLNQILAALVRSGSPRVS
ncbi:hypothetical protein [Methylobacterium sp.]|uniref:hypothetical protein n=1 Tax=Methylobacterium sp. TaxID=409 RepID=UPI000C5AD008|nr:hypothetical protein [Methylobacterium sp.]MBP33174.1 hypothetical protein [Methylobacterium sp.]